MRTQWVHSPEHKWVRPHERRRKGTLISRAALFCSCRDPGSRPRGERPRCRLGENRSAGCGRSRCPGVSRPPGTHPAHLRQGFRRARQRFGIAAWMRRHLATTADAEARRCRAAACGERQAPRGRQREEHASEKRHHGNEQPAPRRRRVEVLQRRHHMASMLKGSTAPASSDTSRFRRVHGSQERRQAWRRTVSDWCGARFCSNCANAVGFLLGSEGRAALTMLPQYAFTGGLYSFIVISIRAGTASSTKRGLVGNSGGAAWESVKANAQAALLAIQQDPAFSGYQIVTDGHSLGGGMSQTFALETQRLWAEIPSDLSEGDPRSIRDIVDSRHFARRVGPMECRKQYLF
jgi:hypothetical protein